MEVQNIGEFELIERLVKTISSRDKNQGLRQSMIVGIGDDAAAWQGDSSIELATIDSLIQDVHFTLDTATFYELGWKALAVNLSDIAAMGGVPRYGLVSLALPGSSKVDDVTNLYQGMAELAEKFRVAVVGGDTCRAPIIMITIAVLGSTETGKHPLTRSAARVGDKIAVTGSLGGAAAGEEMLRKKLELEAEASISLREAFIKPKPRVIEGQLLLENGVKAAIDISDGLISDLGHICKLSGVNARIDVDSIPVNTAVKDNFGSRVFELALAGGEDYEILFTAQDKIINQVKKTVPCPITVIGEIASKGKGEVSLIDKNGKPVEFKNAGWEHFTG